MARATLIVALYCLFACGQSPETLERADSATPKLNTADEADQFKRRQVQVTLNEGTNLALAVHAKTKDRIISLQGSLFLLPSNGDAAIALTDAYYDAREPQFSADGSQVVFQGYRDGNWDIWRVNAQGPQKGSTLLTERGPVQVQKGSTLLAEGDPVQVTTDEYDDREPQFSHDGQRIVFSSDRGGRYDIWSIDLQTGELTAHTSAQSNAHSPSWSASDTLAYVEQDRLKAHLKLQFPDGTEELLAEHVGTISGVQWSPDEASISYQVGRAGVAELKVIDVATKQVRTLSASDADVFPFKAAWLGNTSLAYTADGQIFTRTVGQADTSATREVWPFEVELSLTRHDYGRRARSYDTTAVRQALGLSSPVIGGDGEHVYFSALGDLWHWQPITNSLVKLTDDPYAEYSPALSPDGTTLAYVADTGGSIGLSLMTLASGEVQRVPLSAQQISVPSWSPGGHPQEFFVDVPGNPLGGQLTVLDIATGELKKVLEPMPANPISWSMDGVHIAVSRLNRYSTRYREGLYELVVSEVATGESLTIAPKPHQSIVHSVLTPDGAMTYVIGGLLYRLALDENFQPVETAGQLTDELTDTPQWSANGEYLVYLSGDRLKRLHLSSGALLDITPSLPYRLDAPQDNYVVRASRVLTGISDDYLLDQDIWVKGNRIDKIVPRESVDTSELATSQIVDAMDKTVMAGLFEMHAHMGETSETQGRVWLSYGITSVRDPGSHPYLAKERQEAWDSRRRVGPRTHITGYLTDGNRVFYSMAEGIVSKAHLALALQRTERLKLDFIKTYVRLPDHWQREVVDFAHNLGIPVSSHELYPAVAHGMDHVEHIGGTSRRGYQPKVSRLGYSYGDVTSLLAASDMGITATAVLPGFSVIIAEEPDWFETPQFERFYGENARRSYEYMSQRFGAGAKQYAEANGRLLRDLTKQGALLVTGTDSPFVPYGAGLHAEFRLYDRAGVPAIDIVRQATINSAQAAGVAKDLGTLEAGKLADMIILDGDPLANIRDLDNVAMTIKNGRRYVLSELLSKQAIF